jgi:anti-sigma factor RsiW
MSTQPCAEWRGDVAALAIGRIEPADAVRVQAHVDGCATCRTALAELRRTAAMLPLVDAQLLLVEPTPPSDLPDRILRQVRDERRARRARRRNHRVIGALAGAAAIIAIVAIAVLTRDTGSASRDFALEAPGVDATFALHANAGGTAVELDHRGLDAEDVYWLWLTDATGDRVSAGTFHGSPARSSVTLQSAMTVDEAVRIWVTDEHDEVVLDAQL